MFFSYCEIDEEGWDGCCGRVDTGSDTGSITDGIIDELVVGGLFCCCCCGGFVCYERGMFAFGYYLFIEVSEVKPDKLFWAKFDGINGFGYYFFYAMFGWTVDENKDEDFF